MATQLSDGYTTPMATRHLEYFRMAQDLQSNPNKYQLPIIPKWDGIQGFPLCFAEKHEQSISNQYQSVPRLNKNKQRSVWYL
jgi:hypothetical protein